MGSGGSWGCEACGKRFRSCSAFDLHRGGEYAGPKRPSTRRCLSTEEMRAKGMIVQPNGAWSGPNRFAVLEDQELTA